METGIWPEGKICILTGLRALGIGFEPVSFYYIFDKSGKEVRWIVAEVNNSPWFEQHCYVLPLQNNNNNTSPTENEEGLSLLDYGGYGKGFHVSPFMDIKSISYTWKFSKPGQQHLLIHSYLQEKKTKFLFLKQL